ncbi:MAG: AAA family ATPase [Planctomycetaceae bacterium]
MTTLQDAIATAGRVQHQLIDPLKCEYVGKDEVIDLLGICLVAGENLFLLGPPGTAKSAIVRSLARRLDGRVFDYLLTRFTEPSELFGPFDIRKLREGDLLTNTEGMLPEADVVFLDELLNANSAILNSLLMALNERVFRRGKETRKLGFVLTVGASNRLPEDEALSALFDRFLLRVRSDNVAPEMLTSVLEAGWNLQRSEAIAPADRISMDDLRFMQNCISAMDVSEVRNTYVELVHRLRHAGIEISDRRAVRLQRLAAASAMLCGRTKVAISDLWVLRYIWDTMEQIEVLAKIVNDTIRNATEPAEADAEPSFGAERNVHPRSAAIEAPCPEHLSRDLDQIARHLESALEDSNQKSWIRDRLGLLLSRIEWVQNDESRLFLRDRVRSMLEELSA